MSRLIKLEVIDGLTQNVEGASNSFLATNGDLIADYDGDDNSIPTYTDEARPLPIEVNTNTMIYKTSFLLEDILTTVELDDMLDSNNSVVKKYVKRMNQVDKDFDVESQDSIDLIDAMETDSVLTTLRHDEILLGVPT